MPPVQKIYHFRTIICTEDAPILEFNHFKAIISAEDALCYKFKNFRTIKSAKHPNKGHCCVSENQASSRPACQAPLHPTYAHAGKYNATHT